MTKGLFVCGTYHLYQALHTVMQASSSARLRYVNTETHTSFSPPLSLPTSLKDGRDSRDSEGATVCSSSEEDAEKSFLPLSP